MTDAPERIWAWTSGQAAGLFDDEPHDKNPSTEYIRADLSPSPEVVKELVEALGTVRDYVADTASGHLQYKNRAPLQAMAQEDLARIDALIAKAKGLS